MSREHFYRSEYLPAKREQLLDTLSSWLVPIAILLPWFVLAALVGLDWEPW